ncbi:XdhC family protein [Sporomusa termitida]|uniref:Xanthine dehydrogenase accessory protein XdhC n=1 Tax=Sporomusa termitida TaxID=2377 RepID=A0A517DXV8_9FIRM|nr:XdhC family protein [Sporomusa termitida]QDR82172.1 xanthine dehydrogenase accessory protein XdhC [Sporomusa termitida]
MNKGIFSRLRQQAGEAGSADIITLISAPAPQAGSIGQMLLITGGCYEQVLLDEPFTRLIMAEVARGEWKRPMLIPIDYAGGQYRVFWDKLSRQKSALVLGAGHISQPLTQMLAMVGYAVTVVDDRPDFANAARFPQAEQVVCRSFEKALADLSLSGYGAIIIVTRGHRSDMECLRAVIDQPAAYVGMIGSQGRVHVVINTLTREGYDQDALARLRAPIGLDIGAETPAEIALGIVSEIVASKSNASCRPMSEKRRCKANG